MMDVMNLVEEVNDVFYKQVVAQERKGRLCLTDGRISRYVDFEELDEEPEVVDWWYNIFGDDFKVYNFEELEDSLTDVLDHLRNTYNVDFDIVTMNGRTMVLDVFEY